MARQGAGRTVRGGRMAVTVALLIGGLRFAAGCSAGGPADAGGSAGAGSQDTLGGASVSGENQGTATATDAGAAIQSAQDASSAGRDIVTPPDDAALPTDAALVAANSASAQDAAADNVAVDGTISATNRDAATTAPDDAANDGAGVVTSPRDAGPVGGGDAVTLPRVAAETGQQHGQAYLALDTAPPFNYFIGAWTHVVPLTGTGPKGNDYPFATFCQEGEVSFVSGNFATPYNYNANIMTFDGSGKYIADYTLLLDNHTTEAMCRDWVYVAWHFQRMGGSTNVTQYVKYVGSPNLVDSLIAQSVPGDWTPLNLYVGTDPLRYATDPMYIMYARIYAMDVPPSPGQVQAIYMHSATPDTTAWADWPLLGGSVTDVSGHGRDLTVIGPVTAGIPGPPQLP